MIKTLTNLRKQEKEKFVVPKGVQDVIPITAIYDDGIFQIGKDKLNSFCLFCLQIEHGNFRRCITTFYVICFSHFIV